jgi:glycogen operon protein
LGRTQQGNNNAYCQDNAITWFDWDHLDQDLLAFTRSLISLRKAHPVFRRRRFLAGVEASELGWYTPSGDPMTSADWADPAARCLTLYLDGSDDPDVAADGTLLVDDDFLVMINAWWEPLDFVIPATRPGQTWQAAIDTFDPRTAPGAAPDAPGTTLPVRPRSVVVRRGMRRKSERGSAQ